MICEICGAPNAANYPNGYRRAGDVFRRAWIRLCLPCAVRDGEERREKARA